MSTPNYPDGWGELVATVEANRQGRDHVARILAPLSVPDACVPDFMLGMADALEARAAVYRKAVAVSRMGPDRADEPEADGSLDVLLHHAETAHVLRLKIYETLHGMETKCLDNHDERLMISAAVCATVLDALGADEPSPGVTMRSNDEFVECESCAAKPGSPVPCNACRRNSRAITELKAQLRHANDPLPMLLWCPGCGERHVDQREFATKVHRSHACQHCGLVWRPAIVATVGVQHLPGFKDED